MLKHSKIFLAIMICVVFFASNGEQVQMNQTVRVINGRAMLPLRFISEVLGYSVDWVAEEQKIVITAPKKDSIGSSGDTAETPEDNSLEKEQRYIERVFSSIRNEDDEFRYLVNLNREDGIYKESLNDGEVVRIYSTYADIKGVSEEWIYFDKYSEKDSSNRLSKVGLYRINKSGELETEIDKNKDRMELIHVNSDSIFVTKREKWSSLYPAGKVNLYKIDHDTLDEA